MITSLALAALVRRKVFSNCSGAIQEALIEKLEQLEHNRLAEECGRLDLAYEKAMADEGSSEELDDWPKSYFYRLVMCHLHLDIVRELRRVMV